MRGIRRLLLVLCVMPTITPAAIYKCTHGDKVTYQQSPCQNGVEVHPRTKAVSADAGMRAQQMKQWLVDNDRKHRARLLMRHIRNKEKEIESLRHEMDADMAALKRKKLYANSNLAGAAWEQSISTEMDAVARKYQIKIDSARYGLETMKEELSQLNVPSK